MMWYDDAIRKYQRESKNADGLRRMIMEMHRPSRENREAVCLECTSGGAWRGAGWPCPSYKMAHKWTLREE